MKNVGKIFEEQWAKSAPEYLAIHRLPDDAQSFNRSALRFSKKSPFDFFAFDAREKRLFCTELKSKAGKSISFERGKDDSGDIHYHQIEGLRHWDKYNGTICGFTIEFRQIEKTIFIKIKDFDNLINQIDKKSFSFDDLTKYNINYYSIAQKKARTRYTYDIEGFLNEIKE